MRDSTQRPPSAEPAPRVRPGREGPARAELISVGAELLRGRIADGNARHLARRLTQVGASIRRITVVDDDAQSIAEALREALGRNPHYVVISGGLGPADEDRTLAGVADALNLPMALDPSAKTMVEAAYGRLRQRHLVAAAGLTVAREKLCTLPVGAQPLANPIGISPGVLCRLAGGAAVLCLPGMPDEMQAVLDQALPSLRMPARRHVARREVEAPTADESALKPMLDRLAGEFPDVWIHSRPTGSRRSGGRILVMLEASGAELEEAETMVETVVRRMLALAVGNV